MPIHKTRYVNLKRYDETVLQYLIDHYEQSRLYSGTNQQKISIKMPVNRKTLPDYFDETSLKYDVIHEQLAELERKGWIQLQWRNKKAGHILESCTLAAERIDEIYGFLHRIPRRQKEACILDICREYLGKCTCLDHFLHWLIEQIQQYRSVSQYVKLDEPDAFRRLCLLILGIVSNAEECYLREFSIRCLHDSKAAEKEIDKAAKIIRQFSDDESLDYLTTDELLEEFNIYRNPSFVMMKGYGRVYYGNPMQELRLSAFAGGLGIMNQDLHTLHWDPSIPPQRVLTIENLTSFHQWNPVGSDMPETLCLYLGGYPNRVRCDFLKEIYKTYPQARYAHFGDIDCGGFRIYRNLCERTGIPFHTCGMNLSTYLEHRTEGRALTAADRAALTEMCQDPFYQEYWPLFHEMLKNGTKLEQEGYRITTACLGTGTF